MKRRHECITHKARKTIIAKTGRSDEDKDQDEDEDADDDDDDYLSRPQRTSETPCMNEK